MKNLLIAALVGITVLAVNYNNRPSPAIYSEYSETDPDFAEVNYNDYNRLGDTDFYGFVKADGSTVILEEDMKWTIEKGADLAEITDRLEGFESKIIRLRRQGKYKYTNENWIVWATEAIEGK